MSSHKIRTGRLAKKTFKNQHLYDLIHEMTPAQSSFFREVCLQELGKPPSAFWGKQKIWFSLPNVDKNTLLYMAEALNHSPHITSHKIAENPKAGAGMGGIAKKIVQFGTKAAEYGEKAYKIGKTVYNVLDKVSTGIGVAEKLGVVKHDSAIAKANDLFQMAKTAAGAGFEKTQHRRVRKKTRSY
jgi:hypothetical protein